MQQAYRVLFGLCLVFKKDYKNEEAILLGFPLLFLEGNLFLLVILFQKILVKYLSIYILFLCLYFLNVVVAIVQGQMLTLVEYLMLLYRALLPTPVWYRFFLNKEYGSLFSSLMTGLYLTFKLTSVVEKV